MNYTPILLKDSTAYLVGTPEYATEKPLCLQDKVILELNDKINQLEADKLELSKAVLQIAKNGSFGIDESKVLIKALSNI